MDDGKRSEMWSALLPSRARHNHVEPVMGRDGELISSTTMPMEARAARWGSELLKSTRYGHNPMPPMVRTSLCQDHESSSPSLWSWFLQPEHRPGWGHSSTTVRSSSESTMALDRMMAMYELQITNDHFFAANQADLGQDGGTKLVGASSDLKRKRMELEEADLQGESCGWSHPLKLLVSKGLSLSDVGELGRVIIPKRFAETRFQHLEAKEGSLLEMEDYNGSKRWFFRFKWWTNNKSRMYVLENTGEFIKYHSLKEHDIFAMYEDNVKRLVVRGHKGDRLAFYA